jgi:hypothetical protein
MAWDLEFGSNGFGVGRQRLGVRDDGFGIQSMGVKHVASNDSSTGATESRNATSALPPLGLNPKPYTIHHEP